MRWLAPLLVVFLVKGFLIASIIGPFSGHDEVDHFYYIERLAHGDGLGVVGEVTLPKAAEPYRAYVADFPFNAEVIQPPLYHALLAPIYLLTPGSALDKLYALRLIGLPLGALVVGLSYLSARLLFRGEPLIRAGVPIAVAFQPQFSFEAAIVNHDILVILLFSLATYLLLRMVRDGLGRGRELAIALVVACGLWTKVSFALILPVVFLAVLFAWRGVPAPWRRLWAALGRTVGLPLLLALPWFLRSYALYGDPTGTGKLRDLYGDQASPFWDMLSSKSFWRGRLEDFWGNYGWRQVPFDPLLYRVIWVVWAACVTGLIFLVVRSAVRRLRGQPGSFTRLQCRGLWLLGLSIVLLIYGVLYVGTVQFTQSRFAFPGMNGIAIFTMLGLNAWLPSRLRPAAIPVLVGVLVLLNVVATLRFLMPYYYGPGGGGLILP